MIMKYSFMKYTFCIITIFAFMLSSCETDEEDDRATMCYERNGNYLSLNCYTDYIHSCEDDGKSSLASYNSWEECFDDTEAVLDNWKNNGTISRGPNAIGNSGSSGSGNNGGGSTSCNLDSYSGPTFDIQVTSFCKAAYAYDCAGNQEGVTASCNTYYQYGNSVWTGSGSLPRCKYCD
jgi:hypothetical protein